MAPFPHCWSVEKGHNQKYTGSSLRAQQVWHVCLRREVGLRWKTAPGYMGTGQWRMLARAWVSWGLHRSSEQPLKTSEEERRPSQRGH